MVPFIKVLGNDSFLLSVSAVVSYKEKNENIALRKAGAEVKLESKGIQEKSTLALKMSYPKEESVNPDHFQIFMNGLFQA